jgi:F-box protein, helicase, 18
MVTDTTTELTDEQRAIVQTPLIPGRTLLVLARAGAGKTTTLEALCRANPDKRFLYLAFNKATAVEATQRFPSNCDAKTTHAFSYRYEGYKFRGKGGFYDLNLGDICSATEDSYSFKEAYWLRESLKAFHRSGEQQVEAKHLRGLPMGAEHIYAIQTLWDMTCDPASTLKQSHAGYLKLFIDNICRNAYRKNPFAPYAAILLDEAHDTDPAVERLFRYLASQGRHSLILVGDPHQAIYAWRGATNAMENFKGLHGVHTFTLSGSFRFGNEIAVTANEVLDLSTKLDRGPDVAGLGGTKSKGDHAILSRTNRALLQEALSLVERGMRLHMAATTSEKGWSPEELYNFNLFRSVDQLSRGIREKGMHPRVCQFEDFAELVDYLAEARDDAGDSLDAELSGAVAFVSEHGCEVPKVLAQISAACTSPQGASITVSTAHRAKGLEWDTVRLLDDFEILKDTTTDCDSDDVPDDEPFDQEEVNLLYVAVTRGRQKVTAADGSELEIPAPRGPNWITEADFGADESEYRCEECGGDIRYWHLNARGWVDLNRVEADLSSGESCLCRDCSGVT